MAEATITLTGNGDSAKKALNEVSGASRQLSQTTTQTTTQVRSLTTTTQAASAGFSRMGASISGVTNVARVATPAVGSLGGALGGAAGAAGSLTAALGPAGLAMAAITIALSAATAAFQRFRDSQREAAQASADLAAEQTRLQSELRETERAARQNAFATTEIGRAQAELAQAEEQVNQLSAAQERLTSLLERRTTAEQDLADAQQSGTLPLERNLAALQALARAQAANIAVTEELGDKDEDLSRAIEDRNIALAQGNARLQEARQALERVRNGTTELADETENLNQTVARTTVSIRDLAAEMEAAFRASVIAGAESLSELLFSTGDASEYAATQLARLTDEQLRLLGLSSETISGIREVEFARLSGIEVAQREVAAIEATIEAERRKKDAAMEFYNAQLEAVRELEEAKRLAQEQELLRIQQQKEETQLLFESFRQSIQEAGVTTAIGTVTDGLSSLVGTLASGEKAFDSLGQGALKAFGTIATNFGAVAIGLGTAQLFIPGLQGNAAALIAAGGALSILGAALGGVAKGKEGKSTPRAETPRQRGDVGQTTQQFVVVDSAGRETSQRGGVESPQTARQTGTSMENAERYGIDRARSYTG